VAAVYGFCWPELQLVVVEQRSQTGCDKIERGVSGPSGTASWCILSCDWSRIALIGPCTGWVTYGYAVKIEPLAFVIRVSCR